MRIVNVIATHRPPVGLDSDLNTEQLGTPITINEIIKVLSQLKRNKCADLNSVVADFFIDS